MLNTDYKFGEVKDLASQIKITDNKVNFHGVFSNENGGVVLLAFKAGQKLDTHIAPAELMVTVLEGEIVFTMLDTPHNIRSGEFMLIGEGVPHSVQAVKDAKVMLTKVKA